MQKYAPFPNLVVGGGGGREPLPLRATLVAQMAKNLPAVREAEVQSLGQGDPLEKGMAGYALQYSCLEDPTDRGAQWATVHGVAKSQT